MTTHTHVADTVTQTVALSCGHRRTYPNLARELAESGFAAPGVAWRCRACDPTGDTRRTVLAVHNAPATADH